MHIGGKWVIGVIWDEELRGRIAPGDRIVSIGGHPAETYYYCDFFTDEAKPFASGTVFTVENSAGDLVEITLK